MYVYWCLMQSPCQLMFVSFNSNMAGETYGAGTANPFGAPELILGFQLASCCLSFSFLCTVLYILVCPFSFGHCIVCPISIYGFWLMFWHLQTFLNKQYYTKRTIVITLFQYFFHIQSNRIGYAMVSVLASSVVDFGFESWSGQTKDYKIGICCFSAKHAA